MKNLTLINILTFSIFNTFIYTLSTPSATAQVFGTEQAPPSVKWNQINTDKFQLIYPSETESEARKLAADLSKLIPAVGRTLGREPRRITIILQSSGVESNGFVQLAPRRSEFFLTPGQNGDFQPWVNSLAVHELRHVAQFDKISGMLKAPFFEELALAIFGVTLPAWFYEGDAVGVETALTNAGRGRIPEWDLYFRSNTLSSRNFSYSKNFLGSYKDRTPGYYQLGYFLTTRLRREHGPGIIDSILSRVSRHPFRPYSLSNSISYFTGMNTRKLHDRTVRELDSLWNIQAKSQSIRDYSAMNDREKNYPVDYLLPQQGPGRSILALKRSVTHTPTLVNIDSNHRESLLLRIGSQTEPNFHYSSGEIVWDEYRVDSRFHKRSFNVLMLYNLESGRTRQLTRRSRLFSPTLSPDGRRIAAINFGTDGKSALVELDALDGKIVRTFANPENFNLQTPSYHPSGEEILVVAISERGASILEFSGANPAGRPLIPFQFQQLERPVYTGSQILFKAHYSGQDNIYALEQAGTDPKRITSSRFGASNPSFDPNSRRILFNNYRPQGEDISSVSLDSISGKEQSTSDAFIYYAAPLTNTEPSIKNDTPDSIDYISEPYEEGKNLFYFHSLSPIAEEPSNSGRNLGLKFKSNNKLNTLDFHLGYQYDIDLRRSEYVASFSYKKYYPIFSLNYTNRARLEHYRLSSGSQTQLVPVSWRENFTEAEILIPFSANKLNKIWSGGLRLVSSYTSRHSVKGQPQNFAKAIAFPLHYELYFTRNTALSLRDLAPRWGQVFSVNYNHLPFIANQAGHLFSFRSRIYLPGFFTNHSLQLSFNYQNNSGPYNFTTDIPRISGYQRFMTSPGTLRNTLLIDYRFPILYPDLELGPIAYVKRLKGGLFTDFENLRRGGSGAITYGAEIAADMHVLRFLLPVFEISGKAIFFEKVKERPLIQFGINYSL